MLLQLRVGSGDHADPSAIAEQSAYLIGEFALEGTQPPFEAEPRGLGAIQGESDGPKYSSCLLRDIYDPATTRRGTPKVPISGFASKAGKYDRGMPWS